MTTPAPAGETWVACITPAGTGAIATLALRGPSAWELARDLFRPCSREGRKLPERPATDRFWVGRMGDELADEVVLRAVRMEPVPWVEIHCHGGREVIRMLLTTFEARGVRLGTWPQLETLTAADPLEAAAACALAKAATVRTASILLDQHQGAFARAVEAILGRLESSELAEAGRLLAELARHVPLGRHLLEPWRVVVAGEPNVGKSSLVNALAGYARCVVAATPGTTRDVVTTVTAIDGWPVELVDTAGIHEAGAALEREGIELAREAAARADLCLWVVETMTPPCWPDVPPAACCRVVNKIDRPATWDLAPAAVRVSALTGAGLDELCRTIAGRLVPQPPVPGSAVPFTARLCDLVQAAAIHSQAGRFEETHAAMQACRQG